MSSSGSKQPIIENTNWLGPAFVAFGAILWATDALFRSHLTQNFSPLFIVTCTHTLCLLFTLPLFLKQWPSLKIFRKKEWFAISFIAIGGSALAMLCFTKAFALTQNYNIPILLQKLQPLIALMLARYFLKEKIGLSFLLFAALAIYGAYLLSFGDMNAFSGLLSARKEVVLYTLLAAAIWGGCTVASRFLLTERSYLVITSARYVIATVFLWVCILITGESSQISSFKTNDIQSFLLMAYIPGLFALFIYYHGMQSTKASLATLCELAFPLSAVFINWYFLNSKLSSQQILGALMLLFSVTFLTWRSQKSSLPQSSTAVVK